MGAQHWLLLDWQVWKQADHRGDWALVLTNVIVDLTRAEAREMVRLYPRRITSAPKLQQDTVTFIAN